MPVAGGSVYREAAAGDAPLLDRQNRYHAAKGVQQ
jgi:hypothetical protein